MQRRNRDRASTTAQARSEDPDSASEPSPETPRTPEAGQPTDPRNSADTPRSARATDSPIATDAGERPGAPRTAALSPVLDRFVGIRARVSPADLLAVATLFAGTFLLVGADGGRELRSLAPALGLGAIACVATTSTLLRTPRWWRLIAAAWVLGPLVALVFADVRAGWVRPVAAWALAVPVALCTWQVLKRRWGPTFLLVLAGATLTRAWFHGLLVWWGGGTTRGEPAWLSLSWHNQSGTLMAVLGVGGLAVALASVGWPRVLGGLAGVSGLSATWLSASRGAVVVAAGATLVVLVAAWLRAVRRQPSDAGPGHLGVAVTIVAVGVATVVAVLGLSGMYGGSTVSPDAEGQPGSGQLEQQPITGRGQDAAGNLRSRVGHWEAAVRMFAQAPLTGTGPGSYRWSSVPAYPEDTNLTSSAHGEQVEALGELGVLGGGAALAISLLAAWAVLRRLLPTRGRRGSDPLTVTPSPGDGALDLAAAGVATVLVAHAALDFDWDYPVLLALLAIAVGVLSFPHRRPDGSATEAGSRLPDRLLSVAVAGGAMVLAVVGLLGSQAQTRGHTPWDLDGPLAAGVTSAIEGDRASAHEALEQLERWNPGAPRLPEVRAVVDHALGDLDDAGLAEVVEPDRSAFADQLLIADRLLQAGRADLTIGVIEDLQPALDRRRAWGVQSRVVMAASLRLSAEHELGGCEAVLDTAPGIEGWLATHDLDLEVVADAVEGAAWSDCARVVSGSTTGS